MMKLSPRIVFLMLTCAMLSGCLSGAKLKCQFTSGVVTGYLRELSYYCQVDDNSMYDGSRVTIDGIEGSHLSTNDNVDQIYFYAISRLTYLPRNIQNFFKNLMSICVYNSNLQEISQEDLRPFPKLKEIYLSGTKIKTLDEDLFKYNPELKVIDLRYNQISHIDANVFDGLNYLETLYLSHNQCKSQLSDVATRSEVLKSIQRIKNGDCADAKIIQQKKEEAARIQAIENIKIQQAANEECSAKNAEMKTNLTSMANEKSTLAKDLNDLRVQHEKLESKYDDAEKSIEQLRGEHLLCEKSKNDSFNELHEMQITYEEAKRMNDEKLKSVEKSNSDLSIKILSIEKSKNDKIIELMEELNVLRIKQESLLQNKLEQSEKLVDKLVEKIPVASDDKTQSEDVEKKVSGDGNCLTLFFGPEQRPIILAN